MSDKNARKKNTNNPPPISFHLEAERRGGGMSVVISGIIGVKSFTDNEIILLSHGGRITISGCRLGLYVYDGNNVEISGLVGGIAFKYGKD